MYLPVSHINDNFTAIDGAPSHFFTDGAIFHHLFFFSLVHGKNLSAFP
jgi:hypothetical protein